MDMLEPHENFLLEFTPRVSIATSITLQIVLQRQQCSQPKTLGGSYFEFKRATVFCLGHRVSKHKTTRYAKNLKSPWPLYPLTTLYVQYSQTKCGWKQFFLIRF